jgi:formylglycine-generating enzyme required for sulfatase activity
MRKFKRSFLVFLALSLGISSLSFSGDDVEGGAGFHYWRDRLAAHSKNEVILEMLGEAVREKDGLTFWILQSSASHIFYGNDPHHKSDFQKLILNSIKTYDLDSLKSFYKIEDVQESEFFIAGVFRIMTCLYSHEGKQEAGFLFRLRENFKEALDWKWNAPEPKKFVSDLVKDMDEIVEPIMSYHIRARAAETKSLGSIEEVAVVVEWELVQVESAYNPKKDDLETTENTIERSIVREFLSKAEADKIKGDYGTKAGLPLERDNAIALFQSLSKTTRIVENPSPRDIGSSNWERLNLLFPEGMTFAPIPAGTFMMGSMEGESGRGSDETLHEVTLKEPFWMMTTEVTQDAWKEIMGSNPSHFKGGNLPVENVSWNDAQVFISKLNERKDGWRYRLPTEAEWEYAARAGTTTAFNLGNTISPDQVNYNGNYPYKEGEKGIYREKTVPVGSLPNANAWGLYDMHGNVSEWCSDYWCWYGGWYGAYPIADVTDPKGPATGSNRVIRGGGWDYNVQNCRSAFRDYLRPDYGWRGIGFRLARVRQESAR